MKMTRLFFGTLRDLPSDAVAISHQLMLKGSFIKKVSAGIYDFLPLGLRVLKKVAKIIEEEMDKTGAQQVLMPMVQPCEFWGESGRLEKYGPELLKFKDRKEADFCLGPTHEEVICHLVRDELKSYKQLPINLYQIQTKFRDEIRPRFGLMRGREFLMKDSYSFCIDKKSQDEIYNDMYECYHRIFSRCGLRFKAVKADTGAIGGESSHEFQVLSQTGEDEMIHCPSCNFAANVELGSNGDCPDCGKQTEVIRGIEVGHIFYLGQKYSKAMKVQVTDSDSKSVFVEMGCYGIGVSRTVAAAIEQNHDDKGIIWPLNIAPYHVSLVSMGNDEEVLHKADQIYQQLLATDIEVLFDDRDERAGVKLNDADLIGCPYRIVIGKKGLAAGNIEIVNRKTMEQISVSLSEDYVNKIRSIIFA